MEFYLLKRCCCSLKEPKLAKKLRDLKCSETTTPWKNLEHLTDGPCVHNDTISVEIVWAQSKATVADYFNPGSSWQMYQAFKAQVVFQPRSEWPLWQGGIGS
jgi:folate-dependent tRNA-U54 methylase TrmFO/GidA